MYSQAHTLSLSFIISLTDSHSPTQLSQHSHSIHALLALSHPHPHSHRLTLTLHHSHSLTHSTLSTLSLSLTHTHTRSHNKQTNEQNTYYQQQRSSASCAEHLLHTLACWVRLPTCVSHSLRELEQLIRTTHTSSTHSNNSQEHLITRVLTSQCPTAVAGAKHDQRSLAPASSDNSLVMRQMYFGGGAVRAMFSRLIIRLVATH